MIWLSGDMMIWLFVDLVIWLFGYLMISLCILVFNVYFLLHIIILHSI